MSDADETWTARVSAIAALDEPTRRRLYEFVVGRAAPASRDEAAAAVGAPRATVAFHLDKLVGEGLLEVVYERRTGRSGPGAGRPSKLYRRSGEHIAVSLPERRYELAAQLLADALQESETSGEPPREALRRRAGELGEELGSPAVPALRTLRDLGFEPRAEGNTVVLVNCPFHRLAQQHTELVCGMNLHLVEGILASSPDTGRTARLSPGPGRCCVELAADDSTVDIG